jgi:hypothetical protein
MFFMNSIKHKTIIYIHIPKTAGRTLNKIIRAQYDSEAIFSNAQAVMSKLGLDWQKIPASRRWEISREFLAYLPEIEKRKIKILFGHMNFGRHELLPQPCTYITLLREPAERIISYYYHIKRMKNHYLYDIIESQQLSIGDFIESGITFTLDNCQTRMISGVGDSVEHGRCTHDILDKAKANLKNYFSLVGLTEQFDQTLILLKQKFNWNLITYAKENVTWDRPLLNDIPKHDLQIIRKYNQLDFELYDFAQQLFENQIRKQGSAYKNELQKLREQR